MLSKKPLLLLMMILCLGTFAHSEESAVEVGILKDPQPDKWSFTTGPEFPGAKGSMKTSTDSEHPGIEIDYDFSKGGGYVGPMLRESVSGLFTNIKVDVFATDHCVLNYRLFNPGGRVFQGKSITLQGGKWQTVMLSTSGPWTAQWGGKKTDSVASRVKLGIVISPSKENKKGTVRISNLRGVVPENSKLGFSYPEIDFTLAGWHVKGTWSNQWPVKTFEGIVENAGGADGEFSISFPRMGRDLVQRIPLQKGNNTTSFKFSFPAKQAPNPRNAYQIQFSVKTPGSTATKTVLLKGNAANFTDLGLSPRTSLEIKKLPVGTCTHLSVGQNGAFGIWNNHDRLLKEISRCGFKWIRDGIRTKKGNNGKITIDPYVLSWIQKAKKLDIQIIGHIDMSAKEPIDELKARVAAIAEQTKGLVDVFELGNEPHNFGGWRKVYGGTWNGKESNNETSAWVKEHIKATNAAAESIHAVRPDATLIGTGACTPTNFRYLDNGLSPLVKGIVDHPYSCSMPPERVPYGTNLAKRDGVKVGDDQNSFKGLIESYEHKFAETGTPRKVWVTEFGWSTFWFNGKNHKGLMAGYSERAQAAYLVRRFLQSMALPIGASCQYDFIDDYGSSEDNSEANFGILRSDFSHKPAFYAIQRMNTILGDCTYDTAASIIVKKEEMHRGQVRGELVKDWDKASISANNGVVAYGFADPKRPNTRYMAVWSALPLDAEFNNRVATIRIKGWKDFTAIPVAVNLLDGISFDVPLKTDGGDLVLENLVLTDAPLIIELSK